MLGLFLRNRSSKKDIALTSKSRTKKSKPNYEKTAVELRELFERTASEYEIAPDRLLSRGMYLACVELMGVAALEDELRYCRNGPGYDNSPFDETIVVDTRTWRGRSPLIQSLGRSQDTSYVYNPDWIPDQS